MRKHSFILSVLSLLMFNCAENKVPMIEAAVADKPFFGGFESQVKWGEYLITRVGCPNCHTPKKMTPRGPALDSSLWFSGHPASTSRIEINRIEIQSKGLVLNKNLTEWIGPWGVSFSANLTPDDTGIGNWKEEQFIYAMREGKYKGLPSARPLLPPMPWREYRHFSDDELKAIFAYLRSIKPIQNLVPQPIPPGV